MVTRKGGVVVPLLAGVMALAACEEKKPPPAPKTAATAAQPATASVTAARLQLPWPPMKDQAQDIAADLLARNYYVVLDGSGSMNAQGCSGGQTKMQAAKAALKNFADSVPAHANLGLTAFDGAGVSERVALAANNRQEFVRVVSDIRANGGTPLRAAIERAYTKLLDQGRRQLGYGEYHLVVVTDGVADKGQDPTQIVKRILGESPVVVQTIGFCIGSDHALNQPGATIYRTAENADELRQGLTDVLAEAPQFAVTQFKK